MNRTKYLIAGALAALVIGGGTAGAVKVKLIHTSQIAKGAVTLDRLSPGVQKMVKHAGSNGSNGHDGIPGSNGSNGAKGDAGGKGADGAKGSDGKNGSNGKDGDKGPKGDQGMPGLTGPQGPGGPQGTPGPAGSPGLPGSIGATGPAGPAGAPGQDAPAREYGVYTVNVSRGGNAASAWATYSTLLGSPVGDNTGGVFRFTCTTAQAPCTIAVKAAATGSGSVNFYPRVLVYRQDYNAGGPAVYCEYGDGSTGGLPVALTKGSPINMAAVPVNIGGSADCGGPVATAGDVNVITVPDGYYDVWSTGVFLP